MLEKLIIRNRISAETRQKRKIYRAVNLQAWAAVELIKNSHADPVRLNAGPPPRGLTGSEYMDRVGVRVVAMLSGVGLEHMVEYDHDSSEQSTAEVEAAQAAGQLSRGAEGVRVIFNRLPAGD